MKGKSDTDGRGKDATTGETLTDFNSCPRDALATSVKIIEGKEKCQRPLARTTTKRAQQATPEKPGQIPKNVDTPKTQHKPRTTDFRRIRKDNRGKKREENSGTKSTKETEVGCQRAVHKYPLSVSKKTKRNI